MMNLGLAIGLIAGALVLGSVVGFLIRRLIAEKKICRIIARQFNLQERMLLDKQEKV